MIDETVKCQECGSRDLEQDLSKGELACLACGLVLEDRLIDPGPEWRFNAADGVDNSRVGMPESVMFHDKGKGATFNHKENVSGKTRSQFYRMRKWQNIARVNNNVERNLSTNLSTLAKISSAMSIGKDTTNLAAEIYRKSVEERLIQGRSNDTMIAAAIYGATKINQRPRTLPEISRYARVGQKEIGKGWRLIRKELKLKVPISQPEDFVDRFCSDLGMNNDVRAQAYEIIEMLHKTEYTNGRSPTVIAAGAIYIAGIEGNQKRTQREIAEITDVTEVSIRTCYKHIVELQKEKSNS